MSLDEQIEIAKKQISYIEIEMIPKREYDAYSPFVPIKSSVYEEAINRYKHLIELLLKKV